MSLHVLPQQVLVALGGRPRVQAEAERLGGKLDFTLSGGAVLDGGAELSQWLQRESSALHPGLEDLVPHVSWNKFSSLRLETDPRNSKLLLLALNPNPWSNWLYFVGDIDSPGPFTVWLAGDRAEDRYIEQAILGKDCWRAAPSPRVSIHLLLARRASLSALRELEVELDSLVVGLGAQAELSRTMLSEKTQIDSLHPALELVEREIAECERQLLTAREEARLSAGDDLDPLAVGRKRSRLFEEHDGAALEVRSMVRPRSGLRMQFSVVPETTRAILETASTVARFSETRAPVTLFMVSS